MLKHHFRFTWKVGGEAGFGIKLAGLSFAKACMRAGYHTFDYTEYPSLIRGGHNTYQITIATEPVFSASREVEVLVALNKTTIDKHFEEMTEGSAIIYDGSEIKLNPAKFKAKKISLVSVPLKEISAATGGEIMRNVVAIGATAGLLNLPLSILNDIIKEQFAAKPQVIDQNIEALKQGQEYVKKHYGKIDFKVKLEPIAREKRLLIAGNEAMGMGALAAGVNFFAAYPMTPSTSLMLFLAAQAVKTGLVVKHAEDEISVINMALGAAHVGARAMCGTSGGGYALMGEGLGLCAVSETPLVMVDVQRPGPATGMPTWTDQGDLQFVLHSAQGEFPRIVAAPGDIEECFSITAEAFNWAEKYQLPVILLSDKFLGEGTGTVNPFDTSKVKIERGKLLAEGKIPKNYKRYKVTDDGISPRTLPGMKDGIYWADSYEHTEQGFSSETIEDRIAQVDKRARKLVTAAKDLDGANWYGSPKARITLVAWGSTKGPILDAIKLLPADKQKQIALLHLNIIWPFPNKKVTEAIKPVTGLLAKPKKVVLIENNSQAQLGQIIRQETGIEIKDKILKYDGRPFFPEELAEKINKLMK
ncbi:2-oxoacid:acceptor oxidoreductase subunit alpha [Candidatus Falkowbacteria bacterium]|nr:2-oxoacid:acceptor oxidoreductase subunit alpha [Candidatus Falkowbacteria bacterium]